jgi:hypothetical protein
MLQYFIAFLKDVCPFSTTSMASFSCWSIHLAYFEVLINLLTLPWPCIDVVARWHVVALCKWLIFLVDLVVLLYNTTS